MAGIFSSLSKLFGGTPDVVVGLDIGTSAIKLVQIKREGSQVVLDTYGAVATGPYVGGQIGQIPQINTDAVVQALADLWREANVTGKKVVLSVQSASSLIFVLPLPPVSDRQLAQIVPNEAAKYIPVPMTEVNFDWWRIPNDTAGQAPSQIEVLVAAIRKETIRFYQAILQQAKLQPISFEIETFSGMRSTFFQEIKPVALVDFGASSTRVSVVEMGVIRKFQTINRGAEYYTTAIEKSLQMPFQRAERMKKEVGLRGLVSGETEQKKISELLQTDVQYVFNEIRKVLVAYESERNRVVSKIIVTGGGSRMPGFVEEMAKVVSIPIEVADPFSRIQSPQFLRDTLQEVGPEFATALGAALKGMQSS